MNYPATLIMEWLAAYLWPFCRVSAMLMTMIIIGSQTVSPLVRVKLGLLITVAIAPLLPAMPAIELFSLNGFLVTINQLLIGIALGLISQFLIQTFIIAGQVIAMQTGLGFASMVDPINGGSTPVVGQLYLMLGTLVFFAIDGHLAMIRLVTLSFHSLPVSLSGLSLGAMQELVNFGAVMFQAALAVSLSAIIAMLIINFSFGVMTRAAPQLNIFSLGFAISMVCGLLILWLSLGSFLDHYLSHWSRVQSLMCSVVRLNC
ncbi:flagellar biosynthetic protein FliR [Pseudaeromonas paramecii]|uniref:Flagellar biosynthetic protein FliR n=1 Tax=Pseudaeromonas paramecii TaxID=2138166 RepID=A0ABP8Q4R2_9GAMM